MIAELLEEVEAELDLSELQRIAETCDAKYMDDPNKAFKLARRRIRALKNFDDYRDMLIDRAIRRLVHRSREHRALNARREAGVYNIQPKVIAGNSASVGEVSRKIVQKWLDYPIGGMRLGSMFGKQIDPVAASQQATGDGFHFNAEMLRRIRPLVPDDKRVEDVLSERKIKNIAEGLRKRKGGHAA